MYGKTGCRHMKYVMSSLDVIHVLTLDQKLVVFGVISHLKHKRKRNFIFSINFMIDVCICRSRVVVDRLGNKCLSFVSLIINKFDVYFIWQLLVLYTLYCTLLSILLQFSDKNFYDIFIIKLFHFLHPICASNKNRPIIKNK